MNLENVKPQNRSRALRGFFSPLGSDLKIFSKSKSNRHLFWVENPHKLAEIFRKNERTFREIFSRTRCPCCRPEKKPISGFQFPVCSFPDTDKTGTCTLGTRSWKSTNQSNNLIQSLRKLETGNTTSFTSLVRFVFCSWKLKRQKRNSVGFLYLFLRLFAHGIEFRAGPEDFVLGTLRIVKEENRNESLAHEPK